MRSSQNAILQTLLYSDIFAFPLTRDELWRFLISENTITKKIFDGALQDLLSQLTYHDELYALANRSEIIFQRKQNHHEVQAKIKEAQQVTRWLHFIPTIQFLGISGGVAARNAKKNDDIDFFVITGKNTLWLTRLWILVLLEVLGKRRKRMAKHVRNKICVNLLIEEHFVAFSKERRDLYTAREIAQVIPLFQRGDMYSKFLKKNTWIEQYLPNALGESLRTVVPLHTKEMRGSILLQLFSFLNIIAKYIQYPIMKKHRTNEEISKNIFAFHPINYRSKITIEYQRRKERLSSHETI